jgi:membrane protein implicated in regulation of membrane protease activity
MFIGLGAISIKRKNWLLLGFLISFLPVMLIEMPLTMFKGVIFFVPISCLLLQWKNEKEFGQ